MIVLMVSLFEADVVRSERLGSASDNLDVKLEGRRPVVCSKTDYSAQGILPATIQTSFYHTGVDTILDRSHGPQQFA